MQNASSDGSSTWTWQPTAALVIEIISPDDESRQKLAFYAKHHVDEVLIVDPAGRTVTWLALREGEYRRVERSDLIKLGPTELADQIDWKEPHFHAARRAVNARTRARVSK